MLLDAASAGAGEWVEIGADIEAKCYVDLSSIEVEGDTVRLVKKGIYMHMPTEA